MQDRFPALRTISVLFKVMVWIVVVIGVIAAQAVLVAPLPSLEGEGIARLLALGFTLLATFFYWLILYANAEAIEVNLAIEENTRRTAYEMTNITRPPQPS
ncbi:MAG: hypothetical protein ACUVSE_05360 [Armatimonadota bacterium]